MNKIDIHTHTIASGHAYSTVLEMISSAKNKNLEVLGISEHGIAMPGTCHSYYFNNLKILPRKYDSLTVLFGVEANIIDYEGTLDMESSILEDLDYVIASVHWQCLKPGDIDANTNAYIGAIKNKYVNVIGHADDGRYPIDYDKIVKLAKEEQVLIEINNASLSCRSFRHNAKENIYKILNCCKKYEADVILSSDAHCYDDVTNFDNVIQLLRHVNFPERLIVNKDYSKLKKYIKAL